MIYNIFINSILEQFEVTPFISVTAPILGDFNLSLTNLGLYALITVFLVLGLHIVADSSYSLIPSKGSIALKSAYASVLVSIGLRYVTILNLLELVLLGETHTVHCASETPVPADQTSSAKVDRINSVVNSLDLSTPEGRIALYNLNIKLMYSLIMGTTGHLLIALVVYFSPRIIKRYNKHLSPNALKALSVLLKARPFIFAIFSFLLITDLQALYNLIILVIKQRGYPSE